MSEQTPAPTALNPVWLMIARALLRLAREAAPYALALVIWVVVIRVPNLNADAKRYADELFAVALVLIRAVSHLPPPSKG